MFLCPRSSASSVGKDATTEFHENGALGQSDRFVGHGHRPGLMRPAKRVKLDPEGQAGSPRADFGIVLLSSDCRDREVDREAVARIGPEWRAVFDGRDGQWMRQALRTMSRISIGLSPAGVQFLPPVDASETAQETAPSAGAGATPWRVSATDLRRLDADSVDAIDRRDAAQHGGLKGEIAHLVRRIARLEAIPQAATGALTGLPAIRLRLESAVRAAGRRARRPQVRRLIPQMDIKPYT